MKLGWYLQTLASCTVLAMLAIAAILLLYPQRRWSSRVTRKRKRKRKSQGRVPAQESGATTATYLPCAFIAVALVVDVESEG
jgi:Na+/H+ antiporter NhaD/arsenite permease-like protein